MEDTSPNLTSLITPIPFSNKRKSESRVVIDDRSQNTSKKHNGIAGLKIGRMKEL